MDTHVLSDSSTYIFLPFSFDAGKPGKPGSRQRKKVFSDFRAAVEAGGNWCAQDNQPRYIHKYVSDRLVSTHGSQNACHYTLSAGSGDRSDLFLGRQWYSLNVQNRDHYRFCIGAVHLFFFTTGVGMVALKLCMAEYTPQQIAAITYHLQKVSRKKLRLPGQDKEMDTLTELVQGLFSQHFSKLRLDWFFFSTPENRRANFLTYVECQAPAGQDSGHSLPNEELFYLKWCYDQRFIYDEDTDRQDTTSENYTSSVGIYWGISSAAAACLVQRSSENSSFVDRVFRNNFHSHYLWTYVLMLHQKYTMYLLLTSIGNADTSRLAVLEDYKARLYEFETDFVFSHITEVPQYQRFCTRLRDKFALDALFQDVRDPITQLAEIQQKAHDERLNNSLMFLSLLAIFSAITDAGGLGEQLAELIPWDCSTLFQPVLMGLSFGLALWMLVRLIFTKKK